MDFEEESLPETEGSDMISPHGGEGCSSPVVMDILTGLLSPSSSPQVIRNGWTETAEHECGRPVGSSAEEREHRVLDGLCYGRNILIRNVS